MPVEIRELVIRAVTTMEREDTEDTASEDTPLLQGSALDGNEAIVQECVRQVLRILRKEKER